MKRLTYVVTRGREMGVVLIPHRGADEKNVASPTRLTTPATPFPTQIRYSGFAEMTTCFVYDSHDFLRTWYLTFLEMSAPRP